MILASNRVPGQLLPVGAKWQCNAGRPLNTLQGLGGPLAVSGLGATMDTSAMVLQGVLYMAAGYYVGSNLARKDAKRYAGVVGGLTAAVLGVPGLALTTFLYAPRSK